MTAVSPGFPLRRHQCLQCEYVSAQLFAAVVKTKTQRVLHIFEINILRSKKVVPNSQVV
jgi:hypothetical protein